jgi:hypothetical protein
MRNSIQIFLRRIKMQKSNLGIWLMVLVCIVGFAARSAGITYYVSVGESIQMAIEAASNGDKIEVAQGTYYESIDFMGKAIRLYSIGGAEVTTIDASNTPGAYHVVQCVSGEDANTVLDGFTITGGNAIGPDPNDHSGGGMFNHQSSPTIINCMFIGNTAAYFGGGMHNIDNSNPIVTSCTFSENKAGFGGGIHNLSNSNPTVTSCSFSGNTARWWGGGMRNFQSNSTVTNCTFSSNTVQYNGGGGMHNHLSNTTITNCIFWDNALDEIYDAQSLAIVSYSDVQGGWPGTGNIDTDPCFVQSGYWDVNSAWIYGDYHLLFGSPCIDAGDNTSVPANTCDLDGNPRIVGTAVDMGAYESGFINTPPVACIVGGNRTIEAEGPHGVNVSLDGSCSSDIDSMPGTNDSIVYWDWYKVDPCEPGVEDFLGSGKIINCNLALGEHIIVLVVTDIAGASDANEVTITVQDTTPPEVHITVPQSNSALQDSVIMTCEVLDASAITETFFYLREPGDENGIPIGYEDLVGTLNTTSGKWEYAFDTTQLQDGYYVIVAKATDSCGNEGWSEVVAFSIRNWAVLELLPASENNKAGRTMPVKFSLRIAESVDLEMPFVYNEELEIRIYVAAKPGIILQTSVFGEGAKEYRIDSIEELYITNFKTKKKPAEYVVQIWRTSKNFLIGSFAFKTVK